MEDEFIFYINKVEEFSQSFIKNFQKFPIALDHPRTYSRKQWGCTESYLMNKVCIGIQGTRKILKTCGIVILVSGMLTNRSHSIVSIGKDHKVNWCERET